MSDISSVIIWWLTIFTIGTIFIPVTFLFFSKFADRGYIFSKVTGILLTSYLIWILGSLKILPFTKLNILIILAVAAAVNIFIMKKNSAKKIFAKLPIRLILLEELLFFLALSFWSYVKANEPSIHGLEKFMDFGFVNSILRSNYFPPPDMWLSKSPDYMGGNFINYYYYGHYITAFLTKLSGIDAVITYNLMLAALYAFTLTLSFSIGMNLYHLFLKRSDLRGGPTSTGNTGKALACGLLAAFIVSMGGNLHTIYIFTGNYSVENPLPPWQLNWGLYPERYWYPNATRFIPFTIHEFPIYSFVVSDLHGHVSDIPFVLLLLAILLSLITRNENRDNDKKNQIHKWFYEFYEHTSIPLSYIFILGILLAVMYMINAWDGIIYMILTGLVFLYINMSLDSGQARMTLFTAIYKTFSASLFLVFFFLLTNLPFSLNFRPFVSGIGVLCAPNFLLGKKIGPLLFEAGKCQKSPLWMMATLWGFFYYNIAGILIFIVIPKIWRKKQAPNSKHQITNKSQAPIIKLFNDLKFRILNLFGICNLGFENWNPVNVFISLLILISTLLLIFPEFFYMKDIYPAHYRANTMFKLGYQAFMMLGLVSAFAIIRLRKDSIGGKVGISYILYQAVFVFLFILVGIYPYFAVNSYFNGLKTYHGLDGLNWLKTQYADDYKAIEWMRDNIKCDDPREVQCRTHPVVAEANGDSYTDYARVSANTGLPTIVGWPVHEWLWRGSYDEAGKRIPEVAAIYESSDMAQTTAILKKYNVEYIFIGSLEKEKYKNLDMYKIGKLGKAVFESGGTRIYKVINNI